jgi:hypothetical protein
MSEVQNGGIVRRDIINTGLLTMLTHMPQMENSLPEVPSIVFNFLDHKLLV